MADAKDDDAADTPAAAAAAERQFIDNLTLGSVYGFGLFGWGLAMAQAYVAPNGPLGFLTSNDFQKARLEVRHTYLAPYPWPKFFTVHGLGRHDNLSSQAGHIVFGILADILHIQVFLLSRLVRLCYDAVRTFPDGLPSSHIWYKDFWPRLIISLGTLTVLGTAVIAPLTIIEVYRQREYRWKAYLLLKNEEVKEDFKALICGAVNDSSDITKEQVAEILRKMPIPRNETQFEIDEGIYGYDRVQDTIDWKSGMGREKNYLDQYRMFSPGIVDKTDAGKAVGNIVVPSLSGKTDLSSSELKLLVDSAAAGELMADSHDLVTWCREGDTISFTFESSIYTYTADNTSGSVTVTANYTVYAMALPGDPNVETFENLLDGKTVELSFLGRDAVQFDIEASYITGSATAATTGETTKDKTTTLTMTFEASVATRVKSTDAVKTKSLNLTAADGKDKYTISFETASSPSNEMTQANPPTSTETTLTSSGAQDGRKPT